MARAVLSGTQNSGGEFTTIPGTKPMWYLHTHTQKDIDKCYKTEGPERRPGRLLAS